MFDPATTALLRAVFDEVCEDVPRLQTGVRTHVASKILEAAATGETAPESVKQVGREAARRSRHAAIAEGGVNFQVTVLKILVSYPDGFAVMADLKRDMAILATSGCDWSERTKRLAACVPDLDIFSQALIERLNGGWRITEKRRTVLDFMEGRSSPPQTAAGAPVEQLSFDEPVLRLLVSIIRAGRNQRLQRRRAARARARAKAS